jgi:hypothetical protein
MLAPRTQLARRVLAALDASPSRIPVLIGGCGSGRTTLLHQVRDRIGRTAVQHVDVERTASTPERFLRAIAATSPFPLSEGAPQNARDAFVSTLAFFARARTGGGQPATFLLDEFLELRTFESFPGLRRVLPEFIDGLVAAQSRFVLTSRYVSRTLRALRDHASRFEVIHIPPLTAEDAFDILGAVPAADRPHAEFVARAIHALAEGRPAYVRALVDEWSHMREAAGAPGMASGDPVGALAAALSPGGALAKACGFSYELRLHRARGYGALKAILEILAEEEGLTLTEIAQRLHRTPGSTKDYLSWLEDVDLVTFRQKRYTFTDPLLRVWVRLYCRASAPADDDIAREVHRYALPRLPQAIPAPQPEAAYAMATAGSPTGLIEID